MIINTPDAGMVKTSGKLRTAGFNMKASAKGFKIISTTLYKDPILAIVREIICNAWDAQQINKNLDTPIEVHIPTALEPWFSVKDFGCGMSDDDVFGVYTTVFDSTKDNSNDVIGAMGLGSKTPFSYNNGQSFTVKSVKDGLKAVYSAYLDGGEPSITCMSDPIETNDPDGVEVIVPVNKDDFVRFERAAEKVVQFFTLPSVNTNIDVEKKTFEYMDGYFTHSINNKWSSTTTVHAIMGNVCYPISPSHINDVHDLRRFFKNINLYINFDIGELDVSASREELHYDEHTIKNINARVAYVIKNVVDESQSWVDLQNFEHLGAAYRAANKRFENSILDKLTFNGTALKSYPAELLRMHSVRGRTVNLRYSNSNHGDVSRVTNYQRAYAILDALRDYEKSPIVIIEDDLKTGGVAIAKQYVRVNKSSVYYHHDDKPSTHAPLELCKERLRECEYKILKTSELKEDYTPVKPKRDPAKRKATVQLYVMQEVATGEYEFVGNSIDKQLLKNDSIHYVTLYRNIIETKPLSQRGDDMQYAKDCMQEIMELKGIKTLYILRRGEYEHVKENKNAVYLYDVKFTKKEIRSKLDIKSYTVSNATRMDYVNSAWRNREVQKHFKFKSSNSSTINQVDKLRSHFSEIDDVSRVDGAKYLQQMRDIQENPRYKLLFDLIDIYTNSDTTVELIKLLKKKRKS